MNSSARKFYDCAWRLARAVLIVTSLSVPAWGEAFSIHELGTRAIGMGGAFVAVASDGSAIFYNPAGIAFQPGMRMQMDGLLVHGVFRFIPSAVPPGTVVPKDGYDGFIRPRVIVVPNMYFTKTMSPKLTFGFGAFMPFGLGGNWTNFKDSDPKSVKFVSRFHTTRPKMESVWLQPTVAYRLSERASIGVGVAFVHTHVLLEQSILNPSGDAKVFGEALAPKLFPGENTVLAGRVVARLLPEGRARFAGVSRNVAANLGFLYWHPVWKTRFGVSYRTAVVQHFDGKASFGFVGPYALEPLLGLGTFAQLFPEQRARATFPTPGTFAFGVATEAFGNTLFTMDFQFQDYRRLKYVVLNFTQNEGTATPPESRQQFDFHNAYAVRFGLERKLKGMVARAGWAFDGTPVPDKSVSPLWPDSSRLNFTVGFSKQVRRSEFSFFYQATKFLHRTVEVPANADIFTNGKYNNFAHLVGFALRKRIGGGDLDFRQ